MKSILFAVILLSAAICYAQAGKDSLAKSGGKYLHSNKSNDEKQDVPQLKLNKIIIENHLNFNPTDIGYSADFKKASLKEMVGVGQKQDSNIAEENAKSLLNEINEGMRDKRSVFQKIAQEALGAIQTAVVVGLAVREVVKKKD